MRKSCVSIVSVLIAAVLLSNPLAKSHCIKITRAYFDNVHYSQNSQRDAEFDRVLVIKGENLFGWGGTTRVFVDGERVGNGEWKYRHYYKSGSVTSLSTQLETDHNTIWIKGIVPNANPQDHIIEMTRGKNCRSNRFHVAF
jgi:hypothetical protein